MENKKKPAVGKPAVIKKGAVSTFQSADLLLQSLSGKDVDVVKLEKILELKGKYEAEENRKVYQRKFAELQSALPVIQKTKKVRDARGNVVYQYAPLEKIIEQVKPYLKQYGFSYRWTEGLTEKDGYKRIYCHLMGHGHQESSYCDIPIPQANKLTNNAQMAGSASTYGKRYSFIAITGVIADEDDDGQSIQPETPKLAQQPAIDAKERKIKAVQEFTKKYKEFSAITDPAGPLKVFNSSLSTKTTAEIEKATVRLEELIHKYGGKA